MKETNSDEDDQYALVQVPKPLEPFDHKNDSDDSEDETEAQMKLNAIKEQNSRTFGISLEYSPIEEVKENLE